MAKVTSKSRVTAPRSAPHRPDELGVSKSRESRIHSFDQATERDGKRWPVRATGRRNRGWTREDFYTRRSAR